MRGLMWGIASMANALARMKVIGGHIDWNTWNEPTIVIDPAAISDVVYEPAVKEYLSGLGIPDGTVIYGRVVWSSDDSAFLQYYFGYTQANGFVEYETLPTWNSSTSSFDEASSSTIVAKFANIYGPVEYASSGDKLVQYPLEWDATTSSFIKGDTPVDVYEFPTIPDAIDDNAERYGRIEWDSTGHYLNQYKEVYDLATNTWTEEDNPTVIISTDSHSSQHT